MMRCSIVKCSVLAILAVASAQAMPWDDGVNDVPVIPQGVAEASGVLPGPREPRSPDNQDSLESIMSKSMEQMELLAGISQALQDIQLSQGGQETTNDEQGLVAALLRVTQALNTSAAQRDQEIQKLRKESTAQIAAIEASVRSSQQSLQDLAHVSSNTRNTMTNITNVLLGLKDVVATIPSRTSGGPAIPFPASPAFVMPPQVYSSLDQAWCTPPYFHVGTQCFLMSVGVLTWNSAREACQAEDGDLAQPLDLEELNRRLTTMKINVDLWLGGTDIKREGLWLWLSGMRISRNGWRPHGGRYENCLDFSMQDGIYKLNDYDCDETQHYLCEKFSNESVSEVKERGSSNSASDDTTNFSTTHTDVQCPKKFVQVGLECFYVHTEGLTWHAARDRCQSMDADLAQPSNITLLHEYLVNNELKGDYWLGGTDEGREGLWGWLSGLPLDINAPWEVLQPSGDTTENCLDMRARAYPRLHDYRCSAVQSFICQSDQRTWRGEEPVPSIVTPEENISVMVRVGDNAHLPCVIMNRGDSDVIWKKRRMDVPLAHNKDILIDDERFFVNSTQNFEERWTLTIKNVQTEDSGYYQCIIPWTQQIKQEFILQVENDWCKDPWFAVGGSCFRAFQDYVFWNEAQDICTSHGGILAEPKDFVALIDYLDYKHILSDYWIGGKKLGSRWIWSSTDQNISDFTLQSTRRGNCVEFRPARKDYLGNFMCNSAQKFLCQKTDPETSSEIEPTQEPNKSVCSENEWKCRNGDCIQASWHCDGGPPDCDDNSDEENCGCWEGEWQCKNGQCIPADFRCDADEDCKDGTDETHCDMTTTTQLPFENITESNNGVEFGVNDHELSLPEPAIVGHSAQLECNWGWQNFYSIRWFKDGDNFFTIIPRTNVKIAPDVHGVYVDVDASNESVVVLRNVVAATAGVYRCEIMGDKPHFVTAHRTKNLTVVEGPQFTMETYIWDMPENFTVQKDFDYVEAKSSSRIHLTLTDPSGYFWLEDMEGRGRYGVMGLNKPLDYEDQNIPHIFHMTVTATDSVGSSEAKVIVNVVDVNDNVPVFSNCPEDNVPLKKTGSSASSVIKLQATDSDEDGSAQIVYSIANGSKYFTVNSESGMVIVKSKELEKYDGHYIQMDVQATDLPSNGDNPMYTTCSITFEIGNEGGAQESNDDCWEGEWQCKSGQCIPADFRCDADEDCEDGTDEMHCDMNATTQLPFEEIITKSNNVICDGQFKKIVGRCLYVSEFGEENTWFGASIHCRDLGGQLIADPSWEIASFLRDNKDDCNKANGGYCGMGMWVAGFHGHNESWKWITSTNSSGHPHNAVGGQPITNITWYNYRSEESPDRMESARSCLKMVTQATEDLKYNNINNGLFGDESCYNIFPYICEKDVSNMPDFNYSSRHLGCLDDEWQCNSGQCIPASFRCDTEEDCEDGTDEMCDMNATTQFSFGEISTESNHVMVEPEPILTLMPSGTILKTLGGSVYVSCMAEVEDPELITDMRWIGPNGQEIPNSDGSIKTLDNPSSPGTLDLYVQKLEEKDVGTYMCMAVYAGNKELSEDISVENYMDIEFSDTPLYQTVIEGTDTKIVCIVTANPQPMVDWLKDNEPIRLDDRHIIQEDGILIKQITQNDKGVYRCIAKVPQLGSIDHRDIRVEVKDQEWLSDNEYGSGELESESEIESE